MAAKLKESERIKEPIPIELHSISDVSARAREIHEMIARRAYALYEGRGHIHGHDREDWLQAESEVLALLCVGFTTMNGDLRVDIGITASELPHLRMSLDPWRLIISGRRDVSREPMAEGHKKSTPAEIFQVVNFPFQVEPSGAKATFSNGLLELHIPKAGKMERYAGAKAA